MTTLLMHTVAHGDKPKGKKMLYLFFLVTQRNLAFTRTLFWLLVVHSKENQIIFVVVSGRKKKSILSEKFDYHFQNSTHGARFS